MNRELLRQQAFWNRRSQKFDAIYSHEKSRLANWLDLVFRWDMYERFDYTMRQAEPIANRTFLDVGCGTGRYAVELVRRGARSVIGLDVSDVMIQTCQDRATAEGLTDRLTFVHTDLLAYDPDGRVDVCIGIGLFDYIKNPLPVLKRMREQAMDRAIVSFPVAGTLRARVRALRLKLLGCDAYFHTREQVRLLLEEAGFSRQDMARIGQLHCATAYAE